MAYSRIVCDVGREGGDGQVLSLDLRGHGYDLDTIERFLDGEASDYLACWDEAGAQPRPFDIVETWVRKVPRVDGWMEYVYCGPGRGATPVTSLMVVTPTRHWCVRHPEEPAYVGEPAEEFIDGEALVERELARAAAEIDPRHTVDAPVINAQPARIWFCHDCYRRHAQERDAVSQDERGT